MLVGQDSGSTTAQILGNGWQLQPTHGVKMPCFVFDFHSNINLGQVPSPLCLNERIVFGQNIWYAADGRDDSWWKMWYCPVDKYIRTFWEKSCQFSKIAPELQIKCKLPAGEKYRSWKMRNPCEINGSIKSCKWEEERNRLLGARPVSEKKLWLIMWLP